MDGRHIRFYDAEAATVVWELTLAGLSRSEASALEALFQATEGRLNPFTWLDPLSNLLCWSEDFSAPDWVRGGYLQLTSGQSDPLGGHRATQVTNTGQIAQRLEQSLAAPGSYRYCMSVWARSGAATPVTLSIRTTTESSLHTTFTGGQWTRLNIGSQLQSSDEQVKFGVEIPAGATLDVFGVQAEPQPSPGGYVRTTSRSGVYSARFAQDFLLLEAAGPDVFSTSLKIIANLQG
jgi:hypothetical protein